MAKSRATVFITVTGNEGGLPDGGFLKDDCNCSSEYLPANLCPPKAPLEPCPVRPVGFIPLSEYDQDFKYPLASSRIPSSRPKLEDCGSCSPDLNPSPCVPDWQPTGETSCMEGTIHVEEIDSCGESRWRDTSAACGSCVPSWQNTGTVRCTGTNVENQQHDGCGDSRWHDSGTPVAWTSNGEQQCGGSGTYLEPQINQCGMTRWFNTGVACAEPCVPSWANTGVIRCTGTNIENYQEDGCGNNRWFDSGTLVTWVNSGELVCISGTMRQNQVNQCGNTRVLDTGVACGAVDPAEIPGVYDGVCFQVSGAGTLARTVSIAIDSSGNVTWGTDAGGGSGVWMTGAFNPADYEARITWSGTQAATGSRTYSGTTSGVWYNLGAHSAVEGNWQVSSAVMAVWTNLHARIDIRRVGGPITGGITMGALDLRVNSECP